MISPVPKDSVLLLLPDLHQNDGWMDQKEEKGEDRSCAAQPIDGSIHLAGPDEAETGNAHKKQKTKKTFPSSFLCGTDRFSLTGELFIDG